MIDDIFAQGVFDRIEDNSDKIDNLCGRMVALETKYELHIANNVQKKQDKKDKNIWYVGILAIAVTLYTAFRDFIEW